MEYKGEMRRNGRRALTKMRAQGNNMLDDRRGKKY
jgi:hypothetical protein